MLRAFIITTVIIISYKLPLFAESKIRIAVLDITVENVGMIYGSAIKNLVEEQLFRNDSVDLLERNRIDAVLKEQGFQLTGCTEESCAVEIGKILSAHVMVIGSVSRVKNYNVTLKFVNVQDTRILLVRSAEVETEDEIVDAAKKLSERVSKQIKAISEGKKIIFEDINLLEPYYLMFGLGFSKTIMPAYLEDAAKKSEFSRYGGYTDIFGFYLPLKNERTILGINVNFSSEIFNKSSEYLTVNFYTFSLSSLHFFQSRTGDGFFMRLDTGVAGGISRGSKRSTAFSRQGFSVLGGLGYGFLFSSETRLLFNLTYSFKRIEGDNFNIFSAGAAFLL